MKKKQLIKAYEDIVQPIEICSRPRLRQIANELKSGRTEKWAVGEMLERACIFLDAIEMPKYMGEGITIGLDHDTVEQSGDTSADPDNPWSYTP